MRYVPYLIINVTVDICAHLSGKSFSPAIAFFDEMIKTHTNLKSCPLMVDSRAFYILIPLHIFNLIYVQKLFSKFFF